MLKIGENEYKIEDLSEEVQKMVNRARVLADDASKLQLQLNEVTALANMYTNAITAAVEPTEK
jgi:hypothetical protein